MTRVGIAVKQDLFSKKMPLNKNISDNINMLYFLNTKYFVKDVRDSKTSYAIFYGDAHWFFLSAESSPCNCDVTKP